MRLGMASGEGCACGASTRACGRCGTAPRSAGEGAQQHLYCVVQPHHLLHRAPGQEGGDAREVLRARTGHTTYAVSHAELQLSCAHAALYRAAPGSPCRAATAARPPSPACCAHTRTGRGGIACPANASKAGPFFHRSSGGPNDANVRQRGRPPSSPAHLVVLQKLVGKHLALLLRPRPHKPAGLVLLLRVAARRPGGGACARGR